MSSVPANTAPYFARVAAPELCYHCGLPGASPGFEQVIDGEPRRFCCPACQAVCAAIHDAGLRGFYERVPQHGVLAPPPPAPRELALYDLDEVQAEFVETAGRERDIQLLVEGIHCAACVWLIERALAQLPGVLDARVNLAGKRLLLRWDNETIALSAILARLAQIGYAAVPFDPQRAEGQINRRNRSLLFRMAFAGFAAMNLMWISIALYSGAAQSEYRTLFHWVSLALATPTLFYSGLGFLRGAWTSIRNVHLTMDVPIAIGALCSYFYSVYITVLQPRVGEVYFDTVVNFLFVILVGRYLEALSKREAVASTQRLLDLQPRGALVQRDGADVLLPIRAVQPGDVVLVKPGDRVPVDGTVIGGQGSVDESMLTGESVPVRKSAGAHASAGTLNLDSALTLRVEATLRHTALGQIIHRVEEAQASKAPIQSFADRIVPWFVVITLALATLTFSLWFAHGFEIALMAATAVLIVTCPCAFGLATPMAIAAAAGLGARHGILIKNGGVLEKFSDVDHFVFDKTGTLTTGLMSVHDVIAAPGVRVEELLQQVAAIERYSEHPIARAIVKRAESSNLPSLKCNDFRNQPGSGIRGRVGDKTVIAGSASWLAEQDIGVPKEWDARIQHWEQQGVSTVFVAIDGRAAGVVAVADQLRSDARDLVAALRARGMRLTLLSGDRRRVAEAVAEQLGGMNVIAEVLPQDKDRVVADLQRDGACVAMVGDGVNDAPALLRADVGIAIGSGTDVSGDSADIVLMSDQLRQVRLAMRLAQRTLHTIRQNIGISVIYNIVMVPLAMAALITPLIAAIAMPISSLLVIGNAARLRTLFRGSVARWK